jgi:hypothetical protein
MPVKTPDRLKPSGCGGVWLGSMVRSATEVPVASGNGLWLCPVRALVGQVAAVGDGVIYLSIQAGSAPQPPVSTSRGGSPTSPSHHWQQPQPGHPKPRSPIRRPHHSPQPQSTPAMLPSVIRPQRRPATAYVVGRIRSMQG